MVERVSKTTRRGPDTATPTPRDAARGRAPHRDGRADATSWQVTDDFSRLLLVGAAEIAVLETDLGAALDALLAEFASPPHRRK